MGIYRYGKAEGQRSLTPRQEIIGRLPRLEDRAPESGVDSPLSADQRLTQSISRFSGRAAGRGADRKPIGEDVRGTLKMEKAGRCGNPPSRFIDFIRR